jgi:hypothetical protein
MHETRSPARGIRAPAISDAAWWDHVVAVCYRASFFIRLLAR